MENNNSCCCAPGRKTKRKDCAICGRPLVYFSGEKQLECAICHKMKPAELYVKYGLEPTGCCGLNVCVERDIWRQASGAKCCC